MPLTEADRAAGYWWDIAMRQIEVSRTIVFTTSAHARSFFEALCADNLDIAPPKGDANHFWSPEPCGTRGWVPHPAAALRG